MHGGPVRFLAAIDCTRSSGQPSREREFCSDSCLATDCFTEVKLQDVACRPAAVRSDPLSAHCGLWQTVSIRSIADVRSETQLAKLDKVLDMKVTDASDLAPLMPRLQTTTQRTILF